MKTLWKVVVIILAVIGGLSLLGVAAIIALASMPLPTESQTPQQPYAIATPDEVLSLVNQKRGEAGVEPLVLFNELNVSAQFKAEDMANKEYFGHTDPTTNKDTGLDKAIELTGSRCAYISENMYRGDSEYVTANSSVSGWMESESHRIAMLDKKYLYTGIGIATDKHGQVYQVQHFCQNQ